MFSLHSADHVSDGDVHIHEHNTGRQPRSWAFSNQCLSLAVPPAFVLRATNPGVRRPGNEAIPGRHLLLYDMLIASYPVFLLAPYHANNLHAYANTSSEPMTAVHLKPFDIPFHGQIFLLYLGFHIILSAIVQAQCIVNSTMHASFGERE